MVIRTANYLEPIRLNVPMSDMSIATDDSNFMRTMLLPLHLRPKYKLALAARRQEDVPEVEAMRAFMTEHWYPRQTVPLVPW